MNAHGPANAGQDLLTERAIIPPRRTRFIGALNFGMTLARRTGLAATPVLDKRALLDEARAFTGLEDFGDPWFERPLTVLLEAIKSEARLNAAGEWTAQKQIVKILTDRLWAERWFDRHPEILERPIPKPVVIVGPMRSGTTRLHRLLASDRRFSHLRSFETISPVPRPEFVPGEPDFRVTLAARIAQVARLANPRTLTIHPTGPMQPEEELGLLVNSFWSMKHDAMWWVPSYGRWCERQDPAPAYRQLVRLLKLVGWSQQASSLRPWVLKTPQHVMASAMEQMFNSAEPNWDLKKVDVPVIAINAANPRWTAEYETYVKGLSPKSEYRVIEGVGHCLIFERPAKFNPVFIELLQKYNLIGK